MKNVQWVLFLFVMLVGAACSRLGEKPAAVTADVGGGALGNIPTDAEIENFVAAWQDPDDANTSIRFDVTFGTAQLMPHDMDGFRGRGKIPFCISVNFYRMEVEPMSNPWGRRRQEADIRATPINWDMEAQPQLVRVLQMVNVYSIMDGQAEIAVLDEDGKIVDRVRKDLALLCPS